MNKVYGFAGAVMFVAVSSLPVLAIESGEGTGSAPSGREQGINQPGTGAQEYGQPAQGTGSAPMQGSHTMQHQPGIQTGMQQRVNGTITDIDSGKGLLTVNSPQGPLKLHFPPSAIHDLKKGDRIDAQYAFSKAGTSGTHSTQAFDAPKGGLGQHQMTGTVSKVDQEKGWLYVKTAEATLQLHFPPTALQNVKKGERINVEMAFTRES